MIIGIESATLAMEASWTSMIVVAIPFHRDSMVGCMITIRRERRTWLVLFCKTFS